MAKLIEGNMTSTMFIKAATTIAVIALSKSAMADPQTYDFTLDPPTNYTTQNWPRFVTSADFNSDGYLDLITTNEFSRSVSIYLNLKNGTFATPTSFPVDTGGSLMSLAVGDVNRDGLLDIVVGGYYSTNKVTVLLGLGLDVNDQPLFSSGVQYITGQQPVYISLADFNGDGYLDILSPNEGDGTVAVIENQRNGTFGPPELHSIGAKYWAGSGDLNNDGLTDIAVMTNSEKIAIFYNTGSAIGSRFVYAKTIANGSHESAVGDINGDGIADIVTANKGSSTISVFTNDGLGNFFETSYNSGPNPGWVVIIDLNKDGANDLITCNQGAPSYDIFINKGNGTFSSNLTYSVSISAPLYQASAADLNNDGAIDIMTSNAPSDTLSVFLQKISIATPGSDFTNVPQNSSAVTLEGDDQVVGNRGAEIIDSGPGFDTISPDPSSSVSGNTDDQVDGGPDYDTVKYNAPRSRYTIINNNDGSWILKDNSSTDGTDTLMNVEYIKFSDQTVKLSTLPNTQEGSALSDSLVGTASNDYSFGGNGNDRISSGDGNDYAAGESGSDNIISGNGDDVVDGGTAVDNLSGGDGNDTMKNSDGADSFNGGRGIDTADYSNASGSITVTLNGASVATVRIDTVIDDKLNNVENVNGGSSADTLIGDVGGNQLNGGLGNDSLDGRGGNDVLMGGAGIDKLSGGDGSDVLIPGIGGDTLMGGSGADIFKFVATSDSSAGSGRDNITDFKTGSDKIDLSAIDANSRVGEDQSFAYVNSSVFSGVAGELRFANGILSGDVDGNKVADFEVRLSGTTNLRLSDLRL
jgi:Ca2+-binding RTX toxin-like protein